MPRYFLELSYKGTAYRGFQKQATDVTIQSKVEEALQVLFRQPFDLTTSSRTDAGVHALQNFFHFDKDIEIDSKTAVYRLNAILPNDIAIKDIRRVANEAHSRFDAISRSYQYHIYRSKNPFLQDHSYFYPFQLDLDVLNEAASVLFSYTDFTSFSKRNTQVKTFLCDIKQAEWKMVDNEIVFFTTANRYLRGMVRGLVGTMLRAGRKSISVEDFKKVIEARDCSKADFSVPPQGLFLTQVRYPETIWTATKED